MQIFIRDLCTSIGKTINIIIDETTTMGEFKTMVEKKLGLPVKNQRYTFNAKHVGDVNLKEFLGDEIYNEKWCNMNLYYMH
jgi:hypothetical protein